MKQASQRCGWLVVALLAERAVQAVDRDEGEAVGVDVIAHLLDVHLRGEQLGALGRVDAVEAAVRASAAMAMRMCTSRAPASRIICTIFTRGRAAHDRIVDQDDALAVDQRRWRCASA